MQLRRAFDQPEASAELTVKGFGVVAHHVQPAASGRTLWSERAHDHITARPDTVQHTMNIAGAVLRSRQKMKYSSIVPNIKAMSRQKNAGDVAANPVHVCRGVSQPLPCHFKSRLRDVQNGDVRISSPKEIIRQCRFTGADIDNRRRAVAGSTLNEVQ